MIVELIDYCGSDLTVVNAARVSMNKHKTEFDDSDKGLINYLAKHNHFTPFTHCSITMRETVPVYIARQRYRHTIGFTYNEVSRRYVDDTPDFYIPEEWRERPDKSIKQGSGKVIEDGDSIDVNYVLFLQKARRLYDWMIKEKNVAPEMARMLLPQSMYTSYYVTGSLYAFARAYNLRADNHAQKEIQELAEQWNIVLGELYPESWEALTGGK